MPTLTKASEIVDSVSIEELVEMLSREERFRATVYAMNTLLVQKGIYSPAEFEACFREWARKHHR